MARAETIFTGMIGDPQYGKNVAMYFPKVKQMIAIEEVRTTMTDDHANKKAGISPMASLM